MAIDKQLYTPLSVLLGGALIGAGLFFGLREQGASTQLEAPSERRATPELRGAPLAPPATVSVPRDPSAAQRAAEQALEAQRAAIIAACIPPASRGGTASRLHINVASTPTASRSPAGLSPSAAIRAGSLPGAPA